MIEMSVRVIRMNKEASNDRNYLNKFSNRLLMKFFINRCKSDMANDLHIV